MKKHFAFALLVITVIATTSVLAIPAPEGQFYHYDTPLTAEHEADVLRQAGFGSVRVMNRWENTLTLLAEKTGR